MTWILSLLLTTLSIQAADKSSCTTRELRRLDCRMNSGAHKMRLLPDTIARDDGVWRMVDEMPLKGDWEKMRFEQMAGRPILQLWIWDQGSGETKVHSLHWFVAEVGKAKMQILAEGVVRRRRLRSEKPGDFIFDGFENHELKSTKQGKLEWKLGAQTRILDEARVETEVKHAPKSKSEHGHEPKHKGEHDAH